MGLVRVTVEIANPQDGSRSQTVRNALVDTGASKTLLPRSIADELQLPVVGTANVRTVDGHSDVDQCQAILRIQGRQTYHEVFVSDTYPGVLIGVLTLESLGFVVDPKRDRLVSEEFLLL